MEETGTNDPNVNTTGHTWPHPQTVSISIYAIETFKFCAYGLRYLIIAFLLSEVV